MEKLFDFVEEAFYINLDHRIDKNKILIDHFTKIGINRFIKRARGIYPNELGYTLREETNTYAHEGYAKGCTYAQIEIIEYAKQKKLKNILYFEDDAKFYTDGDYDPLNIIATAIKGLKNIPNWQVLYLGTNPGDRDTYLNMVAPNLVKINESIANHAVLLNHTVFDSVLQKAKEKDFNHLDSHFSSAFTEKYMVYPLCVSQRCGLENDIGDIKYTGMCDDFWLDRYKKEIRILYEN
jgi:hypothetical protein